MRNVVTPADLTEGALWTFVHSNGKRTEYVYVGCMAQGYTDPKTGNGLTPIHRLNNPLTERDAMVSERWMREGPIASHSHWLVGAPEFASPVPAASAAPIPGVSVPAVAVPDVPA